MSSTAAITVRFMMLNLLAAAESVIAEVKPVKRASNSAAAELR